FFRASQVIVGKKKLVGRVNLDHLNAQAQKLFHVRQDVCSVPRVQAAAGQQPPGILFDVVGHELVYAGSEADDLGSHVVDEHRAIDTGLVEVFKESFGRAAELGDLVEVRAPLLHQFKGVRLEHFKRLPSSCGS